VRAAFFRKAAGVLGPAHEPFSYTPEEIDQDLGVRFRPGYFRPFLGEPVSAVADRVRPLTGVFGAGASGVLETVANAGIDQEWSPRSTGYSPRMFRYSMSTRAARERRWKYLRRTRQ
jgi:hypothetical protein